MAIQDRQPQPYNLDNVHIDGAQMDIINNINHEDKVQRIANRLKLIGSVIDERFHGHAAADDLQDVNQFNPILDLVSSNGAVIVVGVVIGCTVAALICSSSSSSSS